MLDPILRYFHSQSKLRRAGGVLHGLSAWGRLWSLVGGPPMEMGPPLRSCALCLAQSGDRTLSLRLVSNE